MSEAYEHQGMMPDSRKLGGSTARTCNKNRERLCLIWFQLFAAE